MRRRFNYTNRGRITHNHIDLTIYKDDNNKPKSFDMKLNLGGMEFPDEGKVYVDVYHRTEFKRYDFGTVSHIITPQNTEFSELQYKENLQFRIIIVNQEGKHGLILADADGIRPESDIESESKSILPVSFGDIGRLIWQIKFNERTDGAPLLVLNSQIPNIENISRTDPQFIMYVYPYALREVLRYMFHHSVLGSIDDPNTDWQNDWIEFGKAILNGKNPPETDPENSDYYDDVENWIDEVIEEFCNSRNEWNKYIEQLSDGEKK